MFTIALGRTRIYLGDLQGEAVALHFQIWNLFWFKSISRQNLGADSATGKS